MLIVTKNKQFINSPVQNTIKVIFIHNNDDVSFDLSIWSFLVK